MKRFAEPLIFLTLAMALHVMFFASRPQTGAEAGGVGGEAMVTLAAAAPTVVKMVESWESPLVIPPAPVAQTDVSKVPDATVLQQLELTEAPRAEVRIPTQVTPEPVANNLSIDTTPSRPLSPRPEPLPELQAQQEPEQIAELKPVSRLEPDPVRRIASPKLPRTPTHLKMPPRPEPAPRPKSEAKPSPRPKPAQQTQQETRVAKPANQSSAGQAGQKAAGSGGSYQAGNSGTAKVKLSKGKQARLKAVWGARIRSRIQKRLRKPGRAQMEHKVVLRLTLSRNGSVLSARISRSSGDSTYDQAALKAVSRSGRFPPAPKKLPGDSFLFGVPITFSR